MELHGSGSSVYNLKKPPVYNNK